VGSGVIWGAGPGFGRVPALGIIQLMTVEFATNKKTIALFELTMARKVVQEWEKLTE
jgi:hypothetical protein